MIQRFVDNAYLGGLAYLFDFAVFILKRIRRSAVGPTPANVEPRYAQHHNC